MTEPTIMWAVSTPHGVLLTHTARETRSESINDYVDHLLDKDLLRDSEYSGENYHAKYWKKLRCYGTTCVRVRVHQINGSRGWSYPHLTHA